MYTVKKQARIITGRKSEMKTPSHWCLTALSHTNDNRHGSCNPSESGNRNKRSSDNLGDKKSEGPSEKEGASVLNNHTTRQKENGSSIAQGNESDHGTEDHSSKPSNLIYAGEKYIGVT